MSYFDFEDDDYEGIFELLNYEEIRVLELLKIVGYQNTFQATNSSLTESNLRIHNRNQQSSLEIDTSKISNMNIFEPITQCEIDHFINKNIMRKSLKYWKEKKKKNTRLTIGRRVFFFFFFLKFSFF